MDVPDNYSSNYDYTNGTEVEYGTKHPEAFILPITFFIIFVVGASGNGMLIFIFLKHKTLRNLPYNTYILLMAIADLLVIMFCLPFMSIIYTISSWPWGVAVCKFVQTAETISMGVSAFTLMALSVERYYAVVKPLSSSRYVKVKTVTAIVAWGIWIFATCLSFEDAIHSRVDTVSFANEIVAYCTPIPNITSEWTRKKYYLLKFLIYYGIPLCIISCFYLLIAIRLHGSANETSRKASQVRDDQNVTKMVLILVFLFFICSLPSHVFYLWFHLDSLSYEKYNEVWHVTRVVGFCLSFLRCCLNPMVLCCCSDLFRTCFKRYFCCRGLEAFQLPEEMHLV